MLTLDILYGKLQLYKIYVYKIIIAMFQGKQKIVPYALHMSFFPYIITKRSSLTLFITHLPKLIIYRGY